ncbi:MAG: hypothetical protein ABF643_00535, partial [Oenococcus oeni]
TIWGRISPLGYFLADHDGKDRKQRTKFYEDLYDLYLHPDKIKVNEEKYLLISKIAEDNGDPSKYLGVIDGLGTLELIDKNFDTEVPIEFTLPEIAEIEKKYPEVKGYKRIRA